MNEMNENNLTSVDCDCSVQVVPVDEEYQPIAALDEGHHQQAGTPTNSSVRTKAMPVISAEEEYANYEHAPNHCNEEEQEGGMYQRQRVQSR